MTSAVPYQKGFGTTLKVPRALQAKSIVINTYRKFSSSPKHDLYLASMNVSFAELTLLTRHVWSGHQAINAHAPWVLQNRTKILQVLRRNGIEMDVRDASFLVRRFGRGGGSQVRARACSHGFHSGEKGNVLTSITLRHIKYSHSHVEAFDYPLRKLEG